MKLELRFILIVFGLMLGKVAEALFGVSSQSLKFRGNFNTRSLSVAFQARGIGRTAFVPHLRNQALFSSAATTSTTEKTPSEPNIFEIELPSNENNENLLRIRHSSAHVMAMAVQRVFPDARVTIGPWIDNG
jgi:threonyl-tRNA synthetase